MKENERRNIERLREAMAEVPKNQEAWRPADIVLDAFKIGKKRASEEYERALDELVQQH